MSWTIPRTWVSGEVVTKALLDAHLRDNLAFLKVNIALEAGLELTIAAGAITKTQSHHTVDTAADAATDDLNCINGGAEGEVLFIRPTNGARTVVVKHQSGAEGNNIWNPSGEDVTLDDADDCLILLHDGAKWCVVGGGSASDLAAHIADTDPHTVYLLASGVRELTGDMAVTALKKIDGRDLLVDGAKLDGIAAGANLYVHPNHSGDVTSVADGATAIALKAVTLAKMDDMATASLIYRKTAAAGAPEVNTLATLKTDLAIEAVVTATKLDDLAAPDVNTDLDASATKHGLCPKGSDVATEFLNGDLGWSTPAGSGGGAGGVLAWLGL